MRRAIFLDRDGTINVDGGYVHKIEDWRWLPGAVEALAAFKQAGWLLIAASNQSGIARGLYNYADLLALQAWVDARLEQQNAGIAQWYYCPHGPGDGCACRKPEPGLVLRAAKDWNIDLAQSWLIGDRKRDAQAGLAAGCRAMLLRNAAQPEEAAWATENGVPVAANLAEAARLILKK